LFKTADEKTSFVRVPVINYLRACPKPEAKAALEEVAKIDPAAMKQAESFFPFAGGPPKTETKGEEKKDEKSKTESKGDAKAKNEPPAAAPPAGKSEAPAKKRSASVTPHPVNVAAEASPWTARPNEAVLWDTHAAEFNDMGNGWRGSTAGESPRRAAVGSLGFDVAIVAAFVGYWTYYWVRT
jgi:hypothetical protein